MDETSECSPGGPLVKSQSEPSKAVGSFYRHHAVLGRLSKLRVDESAERREDWFRVKQRGGEGNVCSVLDYALLCRRGERLREGG